MNLFSCFQSLVRPIFGNFETEELKKFLRMGLVFAFIIGSYWTLRPLKNAVFCTLIGSGHIPYAKTLSLIFLMPLLMLYSRLLDKQGKERTFYIISSVYGVLSAVFALLLAHTQNTSACKVIASDMGWSHIITFVVAYSFYLFVESYGSLLPALFWAIGTDVTSPESAKKGFSFVVAIGQLGGIVGPYAINALPHWLGFTTNALSLVICSVTIIAAIFFLQQFFSKTPPEFLVSYHGTNENKEHEEPGFFDGLRLLLKSRYLFGIFCVVAFPEIIATVFDVHFNSLASQHYTGVHLAKYLGAYGSSVNIIALLFLLCGIGNISRVLGVGISLVLMPIIYGGAVFGFITLDSLTFLFILMASSKAVNYALNGPSIKQLYIPTSHDARLKAQAWIESFGSRGAKEVGSIVNMPLVALQKSMGSFAGRAYHAMVTSYLMFAIVFIWFFIAVFLGKKHKAAIAEKRIVC